MLEPFSSIYSRIFDGNYSHQESLHCNGIKAEQWPVLLHYYLQSSSKPRSQLIIMPNNDLAEKMLEILANFTSVRILPFLGNDESPYQEIICPEAPLFQRFMTIWQITKLAPTPSLLVTTPEALLLKLPPMDFFLKSGIDLQTSDIIAPDVLAQKLCQNGYSAAISLEEPGTFVKKGQIFDIFPMAHPPVRLLYFDDMIEEIYEIDLSTQKSLRNRPYQQVSIGPTPRAIIMGDMVNNFRQKVPMPPPGLRLKYERRKNILAALTENQLFENYVPYLPLFFNEHATLLDYCRHLNMQVQIFEFHQCLQELSAYFERLESDFQQSAETANLLPHYSQLYADLSLFQQIAHGAVTLQSLYFHQEGHTLAGQHLSTDFSAYLSSLNVNGNSKTANILSKIKSDFQDEGTIIFAYQSQSAHDEFFYHCSNLEFSSDLLQRIRPVKIMALEGFFYPMEKILVLTEGEIFGVKRKVASKLANKKIDLFAEQLATLQLDDFLVHADFGIGRYKGLETIIVGGQTSDFLILEYSENDKVYLPVYKMNLVQKHADATATLSVSSLRNNKYQMLKAKAKESAKQLAFDLLQLNAQRSVTPAFAFSAGGHEFTEFELAFEYEATPDQDLAIKQVLANMQKPQPMDHLVCGDVGFGKTEVAMRAAYKAVLDSKQVIVLVPTTILALQHYQTFTKRFRNFPVVIDFLSRFKSPKQEQEIKEKLQQGAIDIIIGTHKLLADSIRFRDLGLVIVDEEQRFGVAHKEKLKLLKCGLDFLTLTATPIPRTLQMAYFGLRELSLIQTPPPMRQNIKTYLIREDQLAIKAAIEKELDRGGQIFMVHNRVQDIAHYAAEVQQLVPSAKIVVAHGQMNEKELETKISDFFKGKYQILISTTIIESGLDIPNANTMIINRADQYGLAQLHQLRGRIGRSERKAYAYLVISQNKKINPLAEKRLQALQTYADIGQGFSIASVDLDLRGGGNILGANQSGHLEAIGLEFYTQLLTDAINELKGEKPFINTNLEIQTPFPAFLPAHYITDAGCRLKYYKKMANSMDALELQEFIPEFTDLYGTCPEEVVNLVTILQVRAILQGLGITLVQVVGHLISLHFDSQILAEHQSLRNAIINFFLARPKVYQFTQQQRVNYTHKSPVQLTDLLAFAREIKEKIIPG